MGKIIDIMISMTQIMSPLIECHLIIGITILLFKIRLQSVYQK